MEKNKNDLSENLDYEVMPSVTGTPHIATDVKTAPAPAAIVKAPSKPRNWRLISVSAAVVLVFLAVSGWAYWKYVANYDPEAETPASTADNIIVPPAVSNTDTDNDGLTDVREEELATDPARADTDGDGLADGDEVNIYHSDPLLPDTDNDTFQDGQEVKDGYSPTVSSKDKASAEEVQAWTTREAEFGLHEPTKTTLGRQDSTESGSTEEKTETAVYMNTQLKYSVSLPNLLEVRESADKRSAGFRIKGATVEDDDVTADPIHITTAINADGSTLRQWVDAQFQMTTDYESLQETKVGALDAIKLTGMPDETCDANKVFFARETTIIIVTWQCNNIQAFGQLFDQIVQSFKFQ